MKKITFSNHFDKQTCWSGEGEAILSSLLRSYIQGVRYGCQLGVCHQCLMHLKEGEVEWISQEEREKLQLMKDEILACCCKAVSDITLEQN